MRIQPRLNRSVFIIMVFAGLAVLPGISAHAVVCPDGISALWKMDEANPAGAGGIYVDTIKGNDGEGADNPTAATGQVNGAQAFAGATAQINVPADRSFNWQSDESFSIEFWIKPTAVDIADYPVADNQVVIGRKDGNLQWWVGIHRDEGKAAFILDDTNGNGPNLVVTAPAGIFLTDGAWHHVVAVRDATSGPNGDNNILYVDGVEQGREPHTYTAGFGSATADVNMGWLDFPLTTNFPYDGLLDEVALYDRALSEAEIVANRDAGLDGMDVCGGAAPFVPFPDDTISLWKLEEVNPAGAGGVYEDAFDEIDGNDGEGADNPTAATGQVNGAQAFAGATAQINVPADRSFNWQSDESFSIEFWIKPTAVDIADYPVADNQVVIGRKDGNLQWWVGIHRDEGKAAFILDDTNGNGPNLVVTAPAGIFLTDGAWHHVVAVRDATSGPNGDNNILYVDGVEQGREPHTYTAGFGSATADVNMGWLDFPLTTNFPYDGLLDEVALYDRALSESEIVAHRDAGLDGNGVESLRPEPLASAGADQTVEEGDTVTLDGSASSDAPNGAIVDFLWEQTSTGTKVTLSGAATDTATFTAPAVAAAGEVLTFQLTVTDNDGLIDVDTTSVTVEDSTTTTTPPPTTSGGGGGGGCFINTMF
jgi:uncharacterized membrane protein